MRNKMRGLAALVMLELLAYGAMGLALWWIER